jgi:hypothetical protein
MQCRGLAECTGQASYLAAHRGANTGRQCHLRNQGSHNRSAGGISIVAKVNARYIRQRPQRMYPHETLGSYRVRRYRWS